MTFLGALVSFDAQDKVGPRSSAPPSSTSPAVQPASSSKDDVLSLLEDVFSVSNIHPAPPAFHPLPFLNGSSELATAAMQPVNQAPLLTHPRPSDSQNGVGKEVYREKVHIFLTRGLF